MILRRKREYPLKSDRSLLIIHDQNELADTYHLLSLLAPVEWSHGDLESWVYLAVAKIAEELLQQKHIIVTTDVFASLSRVAAEDPVVEVIMQNSIPLTSFPIGKTIRKFNDLLYMEKKLSFEEEGK